MGLIALSVYSADSCFLIILLTTLNTKKGLFWNPVIDFHGLGLQEFCTDLYWEYANDPNESCYLLWWSSGKLCQYLHPSWICIVPVIIPFLLRNSVVDSQPHKCRRVKFYICLFFELILWSQKSWHPSPSLFQLQRVAHTHQIEKMQF